MPGTVTVACKLPNGLILHNPDATGVPVGGTVALNGSRHRRDADGNPIHAWEISNTFGLTPNVDADFFEKWLRDNADGPLVKKNIIFAHKSDTRGKTADHREVKTGLEPLDKDHPAPGVTPMKKDS